MGCQTEISKSTRVLFFTKNDDYFLRNQWKMHIFVYYLAKSFATFVVISKNLEHIPTIKHFLVLL